MQILHTDLHTFPERISWENLIEDQSIFPLVIILLILITFPFDYVFLLLGENQKFRGTQREYSSKPFKHSKLLNVF